MDLYEKMPEANNIYKTFCGDNIELQYFLVLTLLCYRPPKFCGIYRPRPTTCSGDEG